MGQALTYATLCAVRTPFRMTAPARDIDAQDVHDALQGDQTAYARIITRHKDSIYAQMWRFSRDRRIVDELVQDVFVEVYTSLPRFRGDAPFLHWMRRIATRTGYRYWRKERRDREHAAAIDQQPWPQWETPTAGLTPSEAAETLYNLLARLEPKDRLVLTLYYLDGCSAAEIAGQMGWSPTLVRVRAHRACKRLRHMMTEAGYGRMGHA